MSLIIRPATLDDAPALSELAASTFRETFERDNTAENLARHLTESYSPRLQAAEIADPGATILLAETEASLIGYAHLAPGTTPSVAGPAPLELKRFYIARPFHGQGVAQKLMHVTLDAARARGARTLWLGVWERNPRAVAFYGKHGFTRVGQHTFMVGADAQTDWILARAL